MRIGLARRQKPPANAAPRRLYAGTDHRTYTQDELRERRRGWLRVHYRADFDLAAEVSAIVGPLAASLSALPRPAALRRDVDAVADATHELVTVVVGMLAESRHLDATAKARTAQAVRDLAQRPAEPALTDRQLASGRWVGLLVAHVAPYTDDLAALLGRALAPNDPRLGKKDSASQRLEAALRVLDTAARDLSRRIPVAARYQARPSIAERNAARRAEVEAQRTRNQLAKMGIEVPAP